MVVISERMSSVMLEVKTLEVNCDAAEEVTVILLFFVIRFIEWSEEVNMK